MTCNDLILIAILADAMMCKDMVCLEPICPLVWGLNPPKEGLCIQNNFICTRVPGVFTFIAIPADANVWNGYVLKGYGIRIE